jgi:hypothetical protein
VRISSKRVIRAFADGDAALSPHARGQVLEELLVYLFRKFPGVRLLDKDVRTSRKTERAAPASMCSALR